MKTAIIIWMLTCFTFATLRRTSRKAFAGAIESRCDTARRQKAVAVLAVILAVFCWTGPGLSAAAENARVTAAQPRFVDKGDGTILDRQTGLMWLKNGKSTLGAIPWDEAGAFCRGLKFAGHSDWRLPSKDEWATIVDTANQSPALPLESPFENVVTFLDYWTETDHKYGPGYAWAVNLYYGRQKFLGKKKYAFAWPVRESGKPLRAKASPASRPARRQWQSLKTRHTLIYYQTEKGLHAFAQALYPHAAPLQSPGANLESRMDALFKEVQVLLDLRKADSRVMIAVYDDPRQMSTAIRQTSAGSAVSPAWYNRAGNTIFVSPGQLSENRLAHEMALAVIYQYMQVPPPRATAKILAGYVVTHLVGKRIPPAATGPAGAVAGIPSNEKPEVHQAIPAADKDAVSPMPKASEKEVDVLAAQVDAWQSSWQNKRLDDYIAHYHSGFLSGGKTRSAWKKHKARLNKKYRQISVSITGLNIEVKDTRAFARFRQYYLSDAYRSDDYKILEFRKEDGRWRIFREQAFPEKPAGWPRNS